jgi:glucosamine-6-phosphate deaminase
VQTRIFETAHQAGLAVAHRMADAIGADPSLAIGLPAGQTPIEVYAELRRLCGRREVDFSRVSAWLIDEFVGVGAQHPGCFRRFVTEHLLAGINLDVSRADSLNGMASDLDAECRRYEDAIVAAGGLGLLLLGIGANGHVGFNEPGEALVARTHCVTLLESTRRDNAALFGGDVASVPLEALSMGIGTILRAGTIVLLATGERKAEAIAGMLRGSVTTQLPASFLQLHPRVDVYLDRAAASAL